MSRAMTVGELKKALEGVRDDVSVVIFLGQDFVKPGGVVVHDFMGLAIGATFLKAGPISNDEFEIVMGETFGY